MAKLADPFSRGPWPVGVRSVTWTDAARHRALPVELYYPALEGYAGQDLSPQTQDRYQLAGSMGGDGFKAQKAIRDADGVAGDFPVVIFSHGYSGDRREFSQLCSHLASHGFRVLSADHLGSTYADVEAQLSQPGFNRRQSLRQMCLDRYGDVPFMLDCAEVEFGAPILKAGCTGVSFGGWTSICAPALDPRVVAIAPQCPGGADGPLGSGPDNVLGEHLRFDWTVPAEMLMIVGDRDSWLPLYGQLATFERCPEPSKTLMIMKRADHQHFVDDMELCHGWFKAFTEELAAHDATPGGPPWGAVAELIQPFENLMPETEAQDILFGFITQHMTVHLKSGLGAEATSVASLRETALARGLGVHVWGA
jgi:dienelactone hydrolase